MTLVPIFNIVYFPLIFFSGSVQLFKNGDLTGAFDAGDGKFSKGEYAVNGHGLLQTEDGKVIPQIGAIGIAGGLLPEASLGGEALAAERGVRLHSANFYHQEVARRLLTALS